MLITRNNRFEFRLLDFFFLFFYFYFSVFSIKYEKKSNEDEKPVKKKSGRLGNKINYEIVHNETQKNRRQLNRMVLIDKN